MNNEEVIELDGKRFKTVPMNTNGDPCNGCDGLQLDSKGQVYCMSLPEDCLTQTDTSYIYKIIP
jgi:hypothetical protein